MKMNFYKLTGFTSLLLLSTQAWADGEAASPAREGGLTQTLIMIAVALGFFYLILWKPEQKRRKAAEKQRASMKVGDRVTAMGIIGTVAKIQDTTIVLKMVDGTSKIEVLKASITDVQSNADESKPEVIESK
ncbi:MAG: preprotein translocase subunit YajC [Rhabdochlamydiaceae bacterium]|nr:preprotein translocase subunit YajC [Rhabdochlamydiaceae bacterium]